ncbi:MAG: acyl-CoA reductase [Gemmatimonadota bacterium]
MSESFDAWWLPDACPELQLETLRVGDLECRYPQPSPELLECTVRALRGHWRRLAQRSVVDIVSVIDAAAARLADPGDAIRQRAEALLTAATGYSPPMTRLVLDRMSADWRAPALDRLLRSELDDPAVLDGFTPVAEHRKTRAYGPRLGFHVFAGNVPGVAVTSLIRSLLVKAPVLGKLASDQPVLPVLFAQALSSVDSELARALGVTYWPGGSEDAEWRALQSSELVVVYGGAEAVRSYRARVPQGQLVVHGPKYSVGLIASEGLVMESELPITVARAVAAFDQHGCVSPHTIWVEDPSGHETDAFADELADAFSAVERELPRGQISDAEISTIQQERGAAEMRGYDGAVRVLAPEGTAWTVVVDHEPVFRPSCLNRFVHVHPIGDIARAVDLLRPVGSQLQSVAIAAEPARVCSLGDALARLGATRITTFDRMPWPPPHWHHDGRGPLRELLRWVDLEESAG